MEDHTVKAAIWDHFNLSPCARSLPLLSVPPLFCVHWYSAGAEGSGSTESLEEIPPCFWDLNKKVPRCCPCGMIWTPQWTQAVRDAGHWSYQATLWKAGRWVWPCHHTPSGSVLKKVIYQLCPNIRIVIIFKENSWDLREFPGIV